MKMQRYTKLLNIRPI